MIHRKRMTALVLCVGMVLSLSVSSTFIVYASGHTCAGRCCRTCVQVAETIALLSSFALLGVTIRTLFTAWFFQHTACVKETLISAFLRTLVGWKVRLND